MAAIKDMCVRNKALRGRGSQDDELARFSPDKWRDCCDLGVLSLPVPKQYGGLGDSMLTTALAIRTLSHHCDDEGLIFSLCAHLCTGMIPILLHGSEAQKQTFLPAMAKGECISGNGATEADAGSDIAAMQLRVETRGTDYCLRGSKIYVTNGSIANLLVVYARHTTGMRNADISAFLVPTSTPGFQVGQIWNKMGLRSSPLCEVVLDDCVLGKEALLGRERRGLMIFAQSMLWERVAMSAYHLGAMERQFNEVLAYTQTRRQFGSRLLDMPAVSDKLVTMRRNIDTAQALLHRACWQHDKRQLAAADASMLKLHVSSGKVENSLAAVQLFGAAGYMKGGSAELQLRDSISATIYSGTSEIQKKLIADALKPCE
jgi:L-prolyl-PCP dehydrogenase